MGGLDKALVLRHPPPPHPTTVSVGGRNRLDFLVSRISLIVETPPGSSAKHTLPGQADSAGLGREERILMRGTEGLLGEFSDPDIIHT